MRMRARVVVALITAAVIAGGCGSGTSANGNNNGNTDVSDFQQTFSYALENNLAGFGTAMDQLIAAVGGTDEPDVTVTAIANGVSASVGVDVDGDGSPETTVNGTLVFLNSSSGLTGGATLTVTSITGGAPQSASGSGTVTQTGPATLSVSNGHFSTHTETQDHTVSITQANLVIDASATEPVITGTAKFTFDGISGTLTFQAASGGGFRVQVSGSGFTTFVVPCATETCPGG